MTKQITILHGDCWEAIYIDGELVTEDHRLCLHHVLNILGYSTQLLSQSNAHIKMFCHLPKTLQEYLQQEITAKGEHSPATDGGGF